MLANSKTQNNLDELVMLRNAVEASGEVVFLTDREGDDLDTFYLVQEGTVDLTIGVSDSDQEHKLVDQITRNLKTEQISVSSIGSGEIFGWSALISPHTSTANAIASTPCQIIGVNCDELRPIMEKDCEFAYKMAPKAAQTVRSRLRDRRIESLAFVSM